MIIIINNNNNKFDELKNHIHFYHLRFERQLRARYDSNESRFIWMQIAIPFRSQSVSITRVCQSKFFWFKLTHAWTIFCKMKQNQIKSGNIPYFFKWIDVCHTHFIIDNELYENLKAIHRYWPIPIHSLYLSIIKM